jgi:hypothetical protein
VVGFRDAVLKGWTDQRDAVVPGLSARYPELFPEHHFRASRWVWAMACVWSRAADIPVGPPPPPPPPPPWGGGATRGGEGGGESDSGVKGAGEGAGEGSDEGSDGDGGGERESSPRRVPPRELRVMVPLLDMVNHGYQHSAPATQKYGGDAHGDFDGHGDLDGHVVGAGGGGAGGGGAGGGGAGGGGAGGGGAGGGDEALVASWDASRGLVMITAGVSLPGPGYEVRLNLLDFTRLDSVECSDCVVILYRCTNHTRTR